MSRPWRNNRHGGDVPMLLWGCVPCCSICWVIWNSFGILGQSIKLDLAMVDELYVLHCRNFLIVSEEGIWLAATCGSLTGITNNFVDIVSSMTFTTFVTSTLSLFPTWLRSPILLMASLFIVSPWNINVRSPPTFSFYLLRIFKTMNFPAINFPFDDFPRDESSGYRWVCGWSGWCFDKWCCCSRVDGRRDWYPSGCKRLLLLSRLLRS